LLWIINQNGLITLWSIVFLYFFLLTIFIYCWWLRNYSVVMKIVYFKIDCIWFKIVNSNLMIKKNQRMIVMIFRFLRQHGRTWFSSAILTGTEKMWKAIGHNSQFTYTYQVGDQSRVIQKLNNFSTSPIGSEIDRFSSNLNKYIC
jgi:hypothetical protein